MCLHSYYWKAATRMPVISRPCWPAQPVTARRHHIPAADVLISRKRKEMQESWPQQPVTVTRHPSPAALTPCYHALRAALLLQQVGALDSYSQDSKRAAGELADPPSHGQAATPACPANQNHSCVAAQLEGCLHQHPARQAQAVLSVPCRDTAHDVLLRLPAASRRGSGCLDGAPQRRHISCAAAGPAGFGRGPGRLDGDVLRRYTSNAAAGPAGSPRPAA